MSFLEKIEVIEESRALVGGISWRLGSVSCNVLLWRLQDASPNLLLPFPSALFLKSLLFVHSLSLICGSVFYLL